MFQIGLVTLRQLNRLLVCLGKKLSVPIFKAPDIFQIRSAEDIGNRLRRGVVAIRCPAFGPYVDADYLEAVLLPGGQHRSLHISQLGMGAASAVNHFIQCVDVGLGRSDDDIGISSLAVNNPTIFFDSNGNFTL